MKIINTMEKFLALVLLMVDVTLVFVLRAWERDKQTLAEVTQNYTEVAAECRVLKEENEQLRQLILDKN